MSNPSQYRRLLRGGGLVVLGNATAAALGLVLLFLLARGFSPSDLAIVVAIIAVIDGGQMFQDATVNIGMVHVASRGTEQNKPSPEALRVGFLTKLIVGIVFALVVALAATPMSYALVGDASLRTPIAFAGMASLVAGLQSFILAVMTTYGKFRRIALVSMWKNALRIVVVLPVLWQTDPDPYQTAKLICFVTAINLVASSMMISWSFLRATGSLLEPLKSMLSVNSWLFLSALGMLASRLDIWLVGWLSTTEQAGYYAVAAQLCIGVGVVTQALVTTFLPTISRFDHRDQIVDFLRRMAKFSIPLLVLPVAAWLVSEWVITLVFGVAYAPSAPIFVFLFVASLMTLIGAPLMLVLVSIDQSKVLAIGTIAQMILRIGVAIVIVPIIGGIGLAMADVGSRLVAMLLITRFILRVLERSEKYNKTEVNRGAEG